MLSLNDAAEATYPNALIAAVLDEYHVRVPEKHREQFKIQLNDYLFRTYTPYVACFCEDGDLLSQWRSYGNEGDGFAVAFGVPWLLSLESEGWRLQKVIYDRRQQIDLILMLLDLASSELSKLSLSDEQQPQFWREVAAQLAPWVVMFKDPAFEREQEWRLVNVNIVSGLSFRRSGHRIVPYVKIQLTPGAIARVIRGPFFRDSDTRGAYLMLVSNNFVPGANVCDSQIPLRR
jgi:hypothetical protein